VVVTNCIELSNKAGYLKWPDNKDYPFWEIGGICRENYSKISHSYMTDPGDILHYTKIRTF